MIKEILESFPSEAVDKVIYALDQNEYALDWFEEWLFSKGPGSDERYQPDLPGEEYLDLVTPKEWEFIYKAFKRKGWVK